MRNRVIIFCLLISVMTSKSILTCNDTNSTKIASEQDLINDEKIAVISQEGSSNYCNWMIEVLTKLTFLDEEDSEYDRIYISTYLPFMHQTLALFDINPEIILEAFTPKNIETQKLIIPSSPAIFLANPALAAEYVRSKLIFKAAQVASDPCFAKKIFISRQKAAHRRIINEDEVFALFQREGFVRYNLEDLTTLEQVSLFHGADIIVAPHGAGLVSLLFAESEALIVELFQEHKDDTFWQLSQVRGLKHHCIKTTDFKNDGRYRDTIIPLSIIEEVILQIILPHVTK